MEERSDLQSTRGWVIGDNRVFGTNLISREFTGNSWTCPRVYRVGDSAVCISGSSSWPGYENEIYSDTYVPWGGGPLQMNPRRW